MVTHPESGNQGRKLGSFPQTKGMKPTAYNPYNTEQTVLNVKASAPAQEVKQFHLQKTQGENVGC